MIENALKICKKSTKRNLLRRCTGNWTQQLVNSGLRVKKKPWCRHSVFLFCFCFHVIFFADFVTSTRNYFGKRLYFRAHETWWDCFSDSTREDSWLRSGPKKCQVDFLSSQWFSFLSVFEKLAKTDHFFRLILMFPRFFLKFIHESCFLLQFSVTVRTWKNDFFVIECGIRRKKFQQPRKAFMVFLVKQCKNSKKITTKIVFL